MERRKTTLRAGVDTPTTCGNTAAQGTVKSSSEGAVHGRGGRKRRRVHKQFAVLIVVSGEGVGVLVVLAKDMAEPGTIELPGDDRESVAPVVKSLLDVANRSDNRLFGRSPFSINTIDDSEVITKYLDLTYGRRCVPREWFPEGDSGGLGSGRRRCLGSLGVTLFLGDDISLFVHCVHETAVE